MAGTSASADDRAEELEAGLDSLSKAKEKGMDFEAEG